MGMDQTTLSLNRKDGYQIDATKGDITKINTNVGKLERMVIAMPYLKCNDGEDGIIWWRLFHSSNSLAAGDC